MKKYSYTIPLYYGKLHVIIADDFNLAASKYKLDTNGYNVNSWEALTSWKEQVFTIVARPSIKPETIAHESAHVVNRLFREVCIDLDYDNDEAFCYMLGWVVKQVHISLDKYNRKNDS